MTRIKAKPPTIGYLFSPAEQAEVIAAEKRATRLTKVQPSQICRKKAKPKKQPGDRFDSLTINKAVRVACERAGVPRWHCHQLRHTAALEISRRFGLEGARSVLGHRTVHMSAHYSGRCEQPDRGNHQLEAKANEENAQQWQHESSCGRQLPKIESVQAGEEKDNARNHCCCRERKQEDRSEMLPRFHVGYPTSEPEFGAVSNRATRRAGVPNEVLDQAGTDGQ
jgi:Phage integrase family